jgi:hypothetical protein
LQAQVNIDARQGEFGQELLARWLPEARQPIDMPAQRQADDSPSPAPEPTT